MTEVAKIRENDYYGGDIILGYSDPRFHDAITIEWKSWGYYGGCTLILTASEAQRLADALQAAPWREEAEAARETVT